MAARPLPAAGRARRRRLGGALAGVPLAALVLLLSGALTPGGSGPRAAAAGPQEVDPQSDASVPARSVTMLGSSPEEPGAGGDPVAWGIGSTGTGAYTLVRYAGGAWAPVPGLPAGFEPLPSPLTGQVTPHGAGVLAGTVGSGTSQHQVVLVRSPGGGLTETAPVPTVGGEALLHSGEALYGEAAHRAPMIAALDEEGGGAGALVAPVQVGNGVESQVLHWDGASWTSEPIVLPAATKEEFRVLALAASSSTNAWLLGQLATGPTYPAGAVALFRRVHGGSGWRWLPVALSAGSGDGEAHPLTAISEHGEPKPFTVLGTGLPPTVTAQLLTVTGEGVWIDGERADVHTIGRDSATLFFRPEGEAGGQIAGSWCLPPPEAIAACQHNLPKALPGAFDRSYAWPGAGPFGQRMITGLQGGISLRLQGEEFVRVLALGGGETPEQTPGARYGATFASPSEGWLGVSSLPVHLTTHPQTTTVQPWPISFRHPLFAIAPQPGVPVGAISSGALAVGELGQVARYVPPREPATEGPFGHWLPESLFGPGGQVQKPRLRAVAWPTPTRAYAVGNAGIEVGEQMWLWRAETGLWEHDPAAPLNFTGNLLGIAFAPNNPTRGYAVGTTPTGGGVLLRYGKSWTQETALPPEVQNAAFVAIAFAGSEAIVAYREQPNPHQNAFVGGLLVNNGSGWSVDQQAAAAIGGGQPMAIAGLPDGGAALEARDGGVTQVYERESAGAAWTPTPVQLPGNGGSLSLFREGGALRALVSGGGAIANAEASAPAEPGFPPNFQEATGVVAGLESGGLLRQTGSGWQDETHELNDEGKSVGGYVGVDLPYRPDSVLATLVEPNGGQGWAVGGDLGEQHSQTADVGRYVATGTVGGMPPGEGIAAVPLAPQPATATFAFGGGAECSAPCAERSLAGVGPLRWLSSAAALSRQIGVQAFVYTGPSVTTGQVSATRSQPIPFQEEFTDTSEALAQGPAGAVYVAAAPQDLNQRPEGEGTEAAFMQVFGDFPAPAFEQPATERPSESPACATTIGCEDAYYSFVRGGVEVIVLDDTGEVDEAQLSWLEQKLTEAGANHRPAIVAGAANLPAQVAGRDGQAERVAAVLTRPVDRASAYFFDAPEEDVKETLGSGSGAIPAFGSGTLGYVLSRHEDEGNFHGASGVVLGQVNLTTRQEGSNVALVTARLIPVIGELALEPEDGTLLRRSQVALFAGLARRPRAGTLANSDSEQLVDPYIPLPEVCVGECSTALLPEYTFSSSNEEVARFVQRNTALSSAHAVLQNGSGEPIFERGAATSGLLCALNKGETNITISAGGLSSTLRVVVQAGSVRQPCGTVPLKEPRVAEKAASAPPPPPTQPSPSSAAPASSPPPVPLPPPPVAAVPPPARAAPAPPPFIPLAAPPAPLLAFVPPPVPTPARPSPPTGTSAVTSPIEVAEKEEEQEEATESVSNQAAAYRSSEEQPEALYVIGILVLAAFAGATLRRGMRGRRSVRVAPATINAASDQRRLRRLVDRPRGRGR
jgi:hypothetical protein